MYVHVWKIIGGHGMKTKSSLGTPKKPERAMTLHEFPFYTTDMWDYDFQMEFAQWLHKIKGSPDMLFSWHSYIGKP